ncbi:MAG: DUF2971 domain-containing protein [Thermodesulfovibrionales bacterium]|jgi:hypothetical protein
MDQQRLHLKLANDGSFFILSSRASRGEQVMAEKKHEPLYHYTCQKGFLGIIENKEMWATNIFFLNDSTEYLYGAELIAKILEDYLEKNGFSSNPYKRSNVLGFWLPEFIDPRLSYDEAQCVFLDKIRSAFDDVSAFDDETKDKSHLYHIFALCFSSKGDDLSQWRGYCPHGIGFCLEFEQQGLMKQMEKEGLEVVECIYEEDRQKEEIEKKREEALDDFKKAYENDKRDLKLTMSWLKAYEKFKKLLPRLKDKVFKDEKECRFVMALSELDVSEISFREGKSMVIPYVKVPLAAKTDPIKIIKKIIVGPTPHGTLSKKSIEVLLRKHGVEKCKVELSKVPYRTWL